MNYALGCDLNQLSKYVGLHDHAEPTDGARDGRARFLSVLVEPCTRCRHLSIVTGNFMVNHASLKGGASASTLQTIYGPRQNRI